MKITGETKFLLGTLLATLVIIVVGLLLVARPEKALTREELLPSDVVTKGNPNASVYLVEFSDFQCPACKSFSSIIPQLLETYGAQIVFGYRHFPLAQHAFSKKAAYASEAAEKQGKFWQMHDFLFQNQDSLSDELLNNAAEELELDKERFFTDMESDEIKNKIERDLKEANQFKVSATPTFFLNGKRLTLTSHEELENKIIEALGK